MKMTVTAVFGTALIAVATVATAISSEARGFVDNVMAAGKKLFLEQDPHCNIPGVPDNFVWVNEILEKAVDWCAQVKTKIEVDSIAVDGGTRAVSQLLPFGHDKMGPQLKDNVQLGMKLALTFAPPPFGQTLGVTKVIAQGVYDLCNDGIERILTKGSGCTQEIGYYRPSKAKHYKEEAARSGEVALFWGDAATTIGNLVFGYE
ncbi:hypothetical protein BDV95DRAFT_589587 [Massariosphaeria phaeospora]|uniref:Uncharacterized protein n=1 Tax=Massariosphaeria phaeospora TaxID=100035 RepID=A0A7C8MFI1_9PLEO|nr:hypothetical protein BDV95DRAFT_589587 [Massariosphaeria phaeospora]